MKLYHFFLFLLIPSLIFSISSNQNYDSYDRSIRNLKFTPTLKNFTWVVPNKNLPPEVVPNLSNNCIGIILFQNILFLGWRSGPFHFASPDVVIYIVSSKDMGKTWQFENKIKVGFDMREPHFIVFNNQLIFSYFEAGRDPLDFEPKALYRIKRNSFQSWTSPEVWGQPGEITWQLDVINGIGYSSSYIGDHYQPEAANMKLYFNYTTDGKNWLPINRTTQYQYFGGVSELGWTLDIDGNFWGVMRNEDGDDSGWGSRIAYASKGNLGYWMLFPPDRSDPDIYESPKMFVHGGDVYLIARRDLDPPFDLGLRNESYEVQKYANLIEYSLRAHTTSVWRLNKQTKKLEFLIDLPGCGDTAFPSIIRIGPNTYLVANYSSPLNHPEWSWIQGQISSEGTQIYFIIIEFV